MPRARITEMLRKVFCTLFAAAMLVSAVSCSSGGNVGGADSAYIGTDTFTETRTETQTETEEETLFFTEEKMDGKNVYRVARFAKKADIDWKKVSAAPIDKYKWVECCEYKAYAQLAFAEDFGFVCRMTCEETNPVATFTKMDDAVCLDSCMEFFVIFDGDKYLNLEANSIGTKCRGFGARRENRKPVQRVLPEGFPAIPEVGETEWTLTYELSMEDIKKFYPDVDFATFASGYEFSGNFYKTGGKDITGNEHYGMWNEVMTEKPDFHQPPYFGTFIME